jgi:adenine phosphoribosyltransferase
MLRQVYENAKVITVGDHLTTVNEFTDQIPALRPKVLWQAALEVNKIGIFNCNKILCEEDKGAPIGTAVSLITGIPLAIARWYPYMFPDEIAVPIACEYYKGNLYVNGIEEGDKITIVDDTISTGGTIISMVEAIRKRNASVEEIIAVVEKVNYHGVEKVRKVTGIDVKTILKIQVENGKVNVI